MKFIHHVSLSLAILLIVPTAIFAQEENADLSSGCENLETESYEEILKNGGEVQGNE